MYLGVINQHAKFYDVLFITMTAYFVRKNLEHHFALNKYTV